MTGKDLLHGMSYVDDQFIEEAEMQPVSRRGKAQWVRVLATAACLGIVIFGAAAFGDLWMPKLESANGTAESVTDKFHNYTNTDGLTGVLQDVTASVENSLSEAEKPALLPDREFSEEQDIHFTPSVYRVTAQYFKTGSPAETADPCVTVLRSRAQLDVYLGGIKNEALTQACQGYDDAWFADNDLLAVGLVENSGSVRHEVSGLYRDDEGQWILSIRKKVPEMGTCDMASWQILVEVESGRVLDAGDTVTVNFQKG